LQQAIDIVTQRDIQVYARSLGSMLDAFGFAGIIEGGRTFARIDATWSGAPTAFALANTNGTLEIGVDDGRILDVDPGASGRLFGLLSLREIPRRLSLDFSDLFKSGMSFNSIKGTFALADGNATTDDLIINSPAADITISGRTGLRSKDYDQEMVVIPRAGVALPVVGALAGGPVGAAAGLVVQTLIGKKLNRAARSRYRVTGSWEKPIITLIGKDIAKGDERFEPSSPEAGALQPPDASGSMPGPLRPTDLQGTKQVPKDSPWWNPGRVMPPDPGPTRESVPESRPPSDPSVQPDEPDPVTRPAGKRSD
jgi:uncharacterized protein YhdP